MAPTNGQEGNGLKVEVLRESLRAISHKGDELVATFYDILFTKYPQVRPMFDSTRMPEQRAKLLRSLVVIVRNLDKPGYLAPYLQGLGKMHVAYGAQAAHYDAVGECLLQAMAKTAGPMWNDELAQAWADAYAAAAGLMKQGAGPN
ncbi:MAG: flavohemoprotein [Acidobacteria bacterium]|nr:flavohemoprotein [Acidobacteriota bacterium]MBI3664494.1 flavohemoprotein [Acidobacteriota bacterium]